MRETLVRAWEPGKSLHHQFTVPPAPEGTLHHALEETRIFALDDQHRISRSILSKEGSAFHGAEPHYVN
jgi:hypothetical protein